MSGIYSVQQIKFEVLAYIKEFGAQFGEWYVGIADDPKQALFEDHRVDPENGIWLYRQAVSFAACLTIQRYFTETLGTDGIPPETGTEQTDCIYLFRKSETTVP